MMSSPSLSLMDEQDGGGTRKRPAAAAASGNVDENNDDHDDTDGAGSNNNQEWREKITLEGEAPQKKFYRQRAHANPLSHNDSFQYPVSPAHVNWRDYFEITSADADATVSSNTVALAPTVLDIGCGFGGLTMRLCQLLPNERILGLEIRTKVTEYVRLRILHARQQQQQQQQQRPPIVQREDDGPEKDAGDEKLDETEERPDKDKDKPAAPPFAFNAAVLRTNSMKYFPNYFCRGSLHKIFICFPDPHFKRKNHPRRIVSKRLLDEYAYGLQINGRLYLITDVHELHLWHVHHTDAHPLFRRLLVSSNTTTTKTTTDSAADAAVTTLVTTTNLIHEDDDPCIAAMRTVTEEGQKVERNQGDKYYAVYERIDEDKKFTSARDFFNQD
jgi:tRNA (guanine-N7-)-methyltransferase